MHGPTAWMLYLYQTHMKEARGLDVKTIDARMRHLGQFAASLAGKDLTSLKPNDIICFKKSLNEPDKENVPKNGSLAAPTIVQICHDLRTFIEWLSKQPGYRTIPRDLADYCTPSRRMTALAHAPKARYEPSPEEIRSMLEAMPATTSQERRDRAAIAFLYLTGVRDGALISLCLKHVDIESKLVNQDAREVNTKFSKTMRTFWFPVGTDIASIVTDWIDERRTSGAQDDDPLFPRTPSAVRSRISSIRDEFWKTASPVREIIRKATEAAGVPYFRPHAVRATLARMCLTWARSPEELKALSQNLGHEDIATTMKHYATLSENRQHELLLEMWERRETPEEDEFIELMQRVPVDKREALQTVAKLLLGN